MKRFRWTGSLSPNEGNPVGSDKYFASAVLPEQFDVQHGRGRGGKYNIASDICKETCDG